MTINLHSTTRLKTCLKFDTIQFVYAGTIYSPSVHSSRTLLIVPLSTMSRKSRTQLLIVKLVISGASSSRNIGALKGLSSSIYTPEAAYNEFYKQNFNRASSVCTINCRARANVFRDIKRFSSRNEWSLLRVCWHYRVVHVNGHDTCEFARIRD